MVMYLTQIAAVRRGILAAIGGAVFFACGTVGAQAQPDPDFHGLMQRWLQEAVATSQSSAATVLRMDVSVGSMDSRLKLAACGNIEAYLPPGSRLWGKTRVGLRCVDGMSRWNVSVPATVKAFGNALVIKGTVLPGAVLTEADVTEVPVDWAEDSSPVVIDRGFWVGQVATRLLTTGQTLRQGMLKPAQVFQAGAQIRVVAQGAGFQISGDAQALSAGVIGQVARVKMDNGRIASGLVLDVRTVKIDL
jgi:flagella basal body P-ring formation protein FlgA